MLAHPPILIPALGPFPAIELHTVLVGLHLLGLCLGLGGATMLYFWIFRWLRRGYLPSEIVRTFGYLSKVVGAGLTLLWLSGLGFLLIFWFTDPAKLGNEKIWAKLIVVAALTLNGLMLHSRITPLIVRNAPMPLLAREGWKVRLLFIFSGAVSGTSWYFAFALGVMRELNGMVSWDLLVMLWAILVSLSMAAMTAMITLRGGGVPEDVTREAGAVSDAAAGVP